MNKAGIPLPVTLGGLKKGAVQTEPEGPSTEEMVTMRADPTIIAAYSPMKKRANFMDEYSV